MKTANRKIDNHHKFIPTNEAKVAELQVGNVIRTREAIGEVISVIESGAFRQLTLDTIQGKEIQISKKTSDFVDLYMY